MIRYAITDGVLQPGTAERWVRAGVDFVQLRNKTADAGELVRLGRSLLQKLGDGPKLLVNGRTDVAAAVGAAGVHLTGQTGQLTAEQVRHVFAAAARPLPLVSISCHAAEQVALTQEMGVDLILFGPVFEKRVDGEVVVAGVGLEALREACGRAPGKVLALGGVTAANAPECVATGAVGVAGIRLFASS